MTCRHPNRTDSVPLPYFGPVAPPCGQNPAAHGGSRLIETCCSCGVYREVLQNGRHVEYGVWRVS